jgi:ABC-type branched-subunit amino acid transport system substrate-binding protein
MLTNRATWPKASPLNNSIKYLIISLITFPIFGQVYDNNYSRPKYTFKSAVEQYNDGYYEDVDLILTNLSTAEKDYFSEDIALLSMRVKYYLNNYQISKEIGKSLLHDHPNSVYKTDVLITFGDIFIAEGMYDAAFRTYIKAFKIIYDKYDKKNIVKRIFLSLQFGISPNIPEELLSIETDLELIQILLLCQAHTELQAGKPTKAANSLSRINVKDLLEINHEYYSKLKDKVDFNTTSRAVVGVVLPLTGKDEKIGREFLEGLKYAEVNNYSNNMDLSLIVYDNAGDELNTIAAFQALTKNPNVVATIGPITADNSIIAASIAETSGIPLIIPTAIINGLSEVSDNIFLMNSDLQTRGELAGQLIAEMLEAENIAVLAPADKFGKSLVDAFTTKLKSYDMVPTIVEWYSGIPMNLDRQFKFIRAEAWVLADTTDSLGLLDTVIDSFGFLDIETDSLDLLDSVPDSLLAEQRFEEEEMTADDSLKIILSSIDAIYMPIHAGHLDYIGAQFPAYNLDAVVVGNDNWSDLEVLRKENIGPHFEGLVVISNYNNYLVDFLNNNFNRKHTDYFYQAIDCYNLLTKSLTEANASNNSLLHILSNIDGFNGLFGTYNFANGSKNVNSTLNIVQFDGYDFDEYIKPRQHIQY